MNLYDLPRGARFRIIDDGKFPPDSPIPEEDEVLTLVTRDGMYSLCHRADGTAVHPSVMVEVERVDD